MQTVEFRLAETQADKITNWKNEPQLLNIKNDFEMAKQFRDRQVTKIDGWNNLMNVTGPEKAPNVKGRSKVQPKLVRRQAEWRYSALSEPFLSSETLWKISPTTFEDADGARKNGLVLNHQWRTKINRVKFMDDLTHSIVDEGTVIVECGWIRKTKMIKETVPTFDHIEPQSEEEIQPLQQAIQLKNSNPRGYEQQATPEIKAAVKLYEDEGIISIATQSGTKEIEVEKVIFNHPIYEVHDPKNIYIDPTCNGDIDKALFVIKSFETSKAEMLKQPKRYKNLDKVNWESNTALTEPDHESKNPDPVFGFKDVLRRKVVAYEYWGFYDIYETGELIPIVMTWIGNVIVRMELNPFPDQKIPFVLAPYMPVKRNLYGEPDAELLGDNQKIQGAITRGLIDLLGKSANSQQGFAKGMLDPLNRRRYENGQDYEFNPNQSPANGLIAHSYPEFPQSALMMLNLQNQEAEALTGVKSFSGGISGQAYGDVALGIRSALDAASKREMSFVRRIAHLIVEMGRKTLSMNQVFLSEKEFVRITNEKHEYIDRDDIQGEYDLVVDIATPEVDDAKSKDLGFMLQTLGPNMDPAITMTILSEIAELKKMPTLANKLRNYQPTPDPLAEKLKELEVQKVQAEIDKLRSEVEVNAAKAKEIEANKDLTNLDYVEQDTGTKHARELEKQAGQARGNQDLQITKALTTPKKEGEKSPDIDAAVGYNELSNRRDDAPVIPMVPPVDNSPFRDELEMGGPVMPM